MSGEGGAIAEVLAAHEADVTSYDAGDIQGCRCGWELPTDLANSWDDKWPAYRAHVADHLADLLAAERQRAWRESRLDLAQELRESGAWSEVRMAEWVEMRADRAALADVPAAAEGER